MPSFKKRIPPPPREPGTHTNAEVKEALHARALRRTVVVAAIVILLLAALAVVYSSAREYTDTNTPTHTPRMVLIVAPDITLDALNGAMKSGKAPFIRLLSSAGAVNGELTAPAAAGSRMVTLLTGSRTSTAANLVGLTSFLGTLKTNKLKPLVVAPSTWWSGSKTVAGTTNCARTGFFDTECSGLACPNTTAQSYCNAFRKYITCDGVSELYRYQVTEAFTEGLRTGADLIYVQVPGLDVHTENVSSTLKIQSKINLLDNTVGQLATTIVQRTKRHEENWNILFVGAAGDGSAAKVPFFSVVYTSGEIVQLQTKLPTDASTADVRGTVLQWFDTDTSSIDATRLLGICSKGSVVKNCQ